MLRRPLVFATWMALVSAGPALVPRAAWAQAPEEIAIARQTAVEGLAAYKAGEFDKALKLFEQARALYPSAQIGRMHGYTLLALRQWEKAAEAMDASLVSSIAPLGEADKKDVEQQLGKAMAHLGLVTVTTRASDAELVVDGGEPLPLPMNRPLRLLEGKYHLVVRAADQPEMARDVDVEGGKKIEIAFDPPEPEAPTPPPKEKPAPPKPAVVERPRAGWFPGQRTAGFITLGTGVALGGVALVTALAGASLRSQVEDDVATHEENFGKSCDRGDPRLCRFDRQVINHDADRADGLRDASVWMGIGAGVLAAGGAVLLVFSPWESASAPPAHHAGLRCAPTGTLRGETGLACRGAF